MNNIQEKENVEVPAELLEEQQVLNDAENIIKKFNDISFHSNKTKLFVIVPLIILILLMLIFSTIFALININKNTIMDGIFIKDIDVSGLTTEEAKEKVNNSLSSLISKEITLSYGDYSVTFLPSQINACFDLDSAVSSAYSIGRTENIFKNNFQILNALTANVNIIPSISYDAELFDAVIAEINSNIPNRVVNSSYYVEDNSLIITNGKNGVIVNSSSLLNEILFALSNSALEDVKITIPVLDAEADPIDLDEIYNSIHKEAVDAYYTTNPYVVYPSSTGVDFEMSLDEAKDILKEYQEQYTIPLKTLYPNVTTNQIGREAFPDLLSEFTTSFTSSNSNRSTNIVLAAAKIDGTVLMPGESFSYNQVVGKRTAAAGFKEAAAYANGEVVQELGGGICQVSSTLYNAVLYANLEVTERYNHYFKPSYVKPGFDATVSWGGPDFCFKNNRTYPIKIICDSSGKNLHISIYGLKSDNDYKVVLDYEYLATVYAKTVYKNDSSLETGATRVISSGSNGCKVAAYKALYDASGNLVSNECISKDTYNAHNKVIAVGP